MSDSFTLDAATPLRGRRIIIGSIGDDIHVVGITILAHALRDSGAEVVQLGVQTQPEEFVHAAVDEDPDAVFVSSSNGHGVIFCRDLRSALEAAGVEDVLLYAGGNLAVSAATPWEQTEAQFRGFGFDRAYPARTAADLPIADLAADLTRREATTDA